VPKLRESESRGAIIIILKAVIEKLEMKVDSVERVVRDTGI